MMQTACLHYEQFLQSQTNRQCTQFSQAFIQLSNAANIFTFSQPYLAVILLLFLTATLIT